MPSNLVLIVAQMRRAGCVNSCLSAVRGEIKAMANRIVPYNVREDAISDALLYFMEELWPRVDMDAPNRKISMYVRISLAGRMRNFARDNKSASEVNPDTDSLDPLTHTDPLAQEMFREVLEVLDGRERRMAELLAAGHSVASASSVLKMSRMTGHRLVLRIRQQLRFCLA